MALLFAVFVGLVLAAWSIAEAGVALGVENEHLSQALAVALWAFSWYSGYRFAIPRIARAAGRRRLLLASIVLILASMAASRLEGLAPGLASYAGLTFASAVAVSVVTSSSYRERFHEEWRFVVAWFKGFTGVFQTLAILALTLAPVGDPLEVLAALIVVAGLLAYTRIYDSPVPHMLLWLTDKISDAILGGRQPQPVGGELSRLASLVGVTAVLKFILMPEALKYNYYLALGSYAAAMAVGAWLAFRLASSRLGSILSLAAILGAWALENPLAGLALISLAAGYTDTSLLVLALESSPRRTPLYVWKALAWIVVSALALGVALLAGLGSPYVVAGAVAVAALVVYRRGSWESWGEPY